MRVGPPAPAGTIVTRTAGKALLRFVNHATGKAINRTLSGLSRETDYPNGTGTLVETGRSWNALGPLSQAAVDQTEPHLLFTTGRIKIAFATTPTGSAMPLWNALGSTEPWFVGLVSNSILLV